MLIPELMIHTIEDRLAELEEAALNGQYPKAPVRKLRKAYIRYCTNETTTADEKLLKRIAFGGEIE